MVWTEQPIFFIDFEGSVASGILEYGVVEVRGGQVSARHARMCRATGRVRPEDEAVHGLNEAALAKLAPFEDDWELFAGLRERGPLAAHFAGAENSLLKSVWPYPRNSIDFARPGERCIDWGPWIDTARLYQQFYPHLSTGRLEGIVAECSLQLELDVLAIESCSGSRRRYHAALYDALAGGLLLASLARDPRLARLTTMQLLAFSTLDGEKRDALQQGELW
jgi:DNA polymerase-3 subunit epsilon